MSTEYRNFLALPYEELEELNLQAKADRARELRDVQTQMSHLQAQLNQLLPTYNSIKEQEAVLKEQLMTDESAQRRRVWGRFLTRSTCPARQHFI